MLYRSLFCIPLVFLSVLVFAQQEKVIISAYEIKGVVEQDRSGDYDQVIQKALQAIDGGVEYRARPTPRANLEFENKEADCIFPVDERFYKSQAKLINSEPINIAKVYIYSRKGDGPWHSLDQIRGKKIGIKAGVPLGPKWDSSGLKAEVVKKDEQNIVKLNERRIDVFLAFVPDMNILGVQMGIEKMPIFDSARPFEAHREALLCHESEKVRSFLKKFNSEIVSMKKKGALRVLLGKSFVE